MEDGLREGGALIMTKCVLNQRCKLKTNTHRHTHRRDYIEYLVALR